MVDHIAPKTESYFDFVSHCFFRFFLYFLTSQHNTTKHNTPHHTTPHTHNTRMSLIISVFFLSVFPLRRYVHTSTRALATDRYLASGWSDDTRA